MNKRHSWLLIAFFCAGQAIIACGDNRTETERVAGAFESINAYRHRDAIIELRNVLRANPDNVDARIGLGVALLATGDAAAAEKELLRARDLGAPARDYADELSQALQSRDAHNEVLAEIDPDMVDDPRLSSILKARRAWSMLALGSRADAEEIFDQELAAGQSVEAQRIALVGKANIAAGNNDYALAEDLLKRSLAIAPDSAETTLALSGLYIKQQRFAEVRTLLDTAMDAGVRFVGMERFMFVAQRIEALLGLHELEEAAVAARELRKLAKDHPITGYLSARVEMRNGNVDEAIAYLQDTLSKFPNSRPAQTLMGAALLQRQDFDEAEMFLSNAVAASPRNVAARRLLAETRLRQNLPEAAIETIREGLRYDSSNAELLTLLGRASVQLGERDAGIELLQQVLDKEPENVQAKLSLAAAYVAQGDGDKAVEILESLPAGVIDERRRKVMIMSAQLDLNDVAEIEKQTDALLKEFPDDPFVNAVAGGFYASVGLLSQARRQYERTLELAPQSQAAMFGILRIDEREDDFSRSRALFEALHEEDKENIQTRLTLLRIYMMQGDRERALTMARRTYELDPAVLLPHIVLANEAMRTGDYDAVDRYAISAVTNNPDSGQAHALMGMTQMRSSEFAAAIGSFERATQFNPNSYVYRYQLAQAQMANDQAADARNSFAGVLALRPGHLPSIRTLAALEARAGNMERAEELVRSAKNKVGEDSPIVLEMIGDVRSVEGRTSEAMAAFAKAQDASPSGALAVKLYNLGFDSGLPDPTRPLQLWIDQAPDDASARLALARAYHRAEKYDAAIEQYEAVTALAPEAVMALNNVAWLYLEKSGPDNLNRARERAQKAYQLMPDNADIADTYGWVLYRSKQSAEGIDMLRKAIALTTPQSKPDIAYHLAAALTDIGAKSEARKLLNAALSSQAQFEARAQARQLLDSL